MKTKPITPYQRLKDESRKYCFDVEYRHKVEMHYYRDAKKGGTWKLDDLAHKVDAAKQLGYDVQLENKDDGLHVYYRKQPPARPFILT
jgi:hypothetical protein